MKWNYFSSLQTSNQRTSFTKYFLFNPNIQKPVLETGNIIIKTGNGIIFATKTSNQKTFCTIYLPFHLKNTKQVKEIEEIEISFLFTNFRHKKIREI